MKPLAVVKFLVTKKLIKETDLVNPGILICRIISLPLVKGFVYIGVAPNVITGLSCIALALAGYLIYSGNIGLSVLFVTVGALLDFCDGMVARHTSTATKMGGYFDYISDRFKNIYLLIVLSVVVNGWLSALFIVAIFALIFKEIMIWFSPYQRIYEKHGIALWSLLFGKYHEAVSVLFRNDPWQLVLAGALGLTIGRDGFIWGMIYYSVTILVDWIVFIRAHLNIFVPASIPERCLVIRKKDFSLREKIAVYYSKLRGNKDLRG